MINLSVAIHHSTFSIFYWLLTSHLLSNRRNGLLGMKSYYHHFSLAKEKVMLIDIVYISYNLNPNTKECKTFYAEDLLIGPTNWIICLSMPHLSSRVTTISLTKRV